MICQKLCQNSGSVQGSLEESNFAPVFALSLGLAVSDPWSTTVYIVSALPGEHSGECPTFFT